MIDLAGNFAVSLYAWAVMSNHSHVVLFIDPSAAARWTDEEVADRWSRIHRTLEPDLSPDAIRRRDERRQALLTNPERLLEIRNRLGSLSWYMRFLNEAIALAANREDRCTGRFWEGRFHCKALTNETALLGGMAYSDLNPIRAGLTEHLQDSRYTSVYRRLISLREDPAAADVQLRPIVGPSAESFPTISNRRYVELVDWTGRMVRPDKKGHISGPPPDWLGTDRSGQPQWLLMSTAVETIFGAAVGDAPALEDFAKQTGRSWVRGVGAVR